MSKQAASSRDSVKGGFNDYRNSTLASSSHVEEVSVVVCLEWNLFHTELQTHTTQCIYNAQSWSCCIRLCSYPYHLVVLLKSLVLTNKLLRLPEIRCFSSSALSDHAENKAKCADSEEGATAHSHLSWARGHRTLLYHTAHKEQVPGWLQGKMKLAQ